MRWIYHCPDVELKDRAGNLIKHEDGKPFVATHAGILESCTNAACWRSDRKTAWRAIKVLEKIEASKPGRWIGFEDADYDRMVKGLDDVLRPNAKGEMPATWFMRQQRCLFAAVILAKKQDGCPDVMSNMQEAAYIAELEAYEDE